VSSADLSGPAVFRVIQCESPCRGVWVQDWFQGQPSLFRRDRQGDGPTFKAASSPNGKSGDIVIGRYMSDESRITAFWKIDAYFISLPSLQYKMPPSVRWRKQNVVMYLFPYVSE
jgi:hypothetical protein